MKVRWTFKLPDIEVRRTGNLLSVEAMVHKHKLYWTGHIIRVNDSKIPKWDNC